MNSNNNSFFIGKVVHELERVDSTNSFAMRLLSEKKVAEGTVIVAKEQFAGRGQMGTEWKSAKGKNLTLSIVLKPKNLLAKEQFHLNMAIALGVSNCVQNVLSQSVYIKWPNDIYIENKKTGGILIQNTLSGAHIQRSVVGIGLNVNQVDFPSHLPNPTSLSLSGKRSYDLIRIRQLLFKQIEIFYLQLKAGKKALLKAQYLDKLYRYNELAQYQKANGDIFTGSITDISKEGELVIANADSLQTESYKLKEIAFLQPSK